MKSLQERFDEKWIPEPNSGCWLWVGAASKNGGNPNDLRPFILNGRNEIAYRTSYKLHCGEIPDGACVCHRCDNGMCVNPDHLFIGTTRDNVHDAIRKGRRRYLVGERHHQAKLSDNDAAEVIELRRQGLLLREIAAKYGVSRECVGNIVSGRRRAVS